MNLDYILERMADNAATVESLARSVGEEQARWKPSPTEWSILEVINHLYDEEREDFRTRLDYTLHRPGQPWPPIDPEGWVVARSYNSRELQPSLDNFLAERRRSMAWLRSLQAPNWSATYTHPRAGAITAGALLASWLAHDFLHIRQLTQLHWQFIGVVAPDCPVTYAGPW
ncbi:DinB family protein [Litorilinea aerophila]|uniref:DinB family protein n=1 Tax=Litorilinea aerophila TaxID=1204385 RepID=A0A540VLG4_9CHLR|nr:DinB family protein [Litorilinea aerophila]MCC9074772.1 DinB family protein [Litorilinea aerophila]GIV77906.1 MAG: hypothetical protein KatS3mg050_2300 [Litorilinea sp.]